MIVCPGSGATGRNFNVAAAEQMIACFFFFFERYGAPRDLHVRLHSFPTRRSSDLGCWPRTTAGASSRLIRTLAGRRRLSRSEEHTSELQSQSHISYAVFCLKKK